jgi:hypothetical protein
MQSPLTRRDETRPGLFARILKRTHVQGFSVSLENFLIDQDALSGLDQPSLEQLMFDNNVQSLEQVSSVTSDLVTRLALALPPAQFGKDGERQIRELAIRLEVSAELAEGAFNEGAFRHYLAALKLYATDAALDEWERTELKRLRELLRISDDQNQSACSAVLEPLIQNVVSSSLADGRLSPAEEQEISDAAARLGVSVDLHGDSESILESARVLWQIENENLPVVGSPVNLQRGEVCHAWLTAEATEIRERTVAVGYAGPSVRLRIMKGVDHVPTRGVASVCPPCFRCSTGLVMRRGLPRA